MGTFDTWRDNNWEDIFNLTPSEHISMYAEYVAQNEAVKFAKWLLYSEHYPSADGIHWHDCASQEVTPEQLYSLFKSEQDGKE